MAQLQLDEQGIFEVARGIGSTQAREAYLQSACGGDDVMKQRVAALLSAFEENESFLESPPLGLSGGPPELNGAFTIDRPVTEAAGTAIGPYKLLQQIGEGGMGVVFMAEQTAPVRRKVALKIIKPGMDTRQVIARFEAERQALALMDHPNIARVFDAGTTETGRPYFVMELVHGVPITDYCDLQKLSPPERLRLFIDVCRAVQHAHQKGIIHRDLKSSNVMVTMHDDRPVPKIIDFGVSKAISHQLTEKTLFTAYGQIVGTPTYMSPEQAQLSGLDVDTRSDIYCLGVLLYELTTGTTPFDEATLKRAGFDEMRRMIREDEPLWPSAKINTLEAKFLTTVADQRKVDPRKLSQALYGEVDWIVMKCLEKDRNRRYDSANSLAADIERYLNDEPVQACPPSVTYRLGKFVRRHKAALATAATMVALLIVGVFGLAFGSLLIWRANNEAHRLSYFQRVALAEREWSANNLKRADELLNQCPPDLRGWEWNYVKQLRSRQMQPLRHDNTITDCAVSPDGTQVASLDWNGYLHCWDATSGREIWPPVRGHDSSEGVICDVVFSADGTKFASTGWQDVKVWDSRNGEQLHLWNAPANSEITGLAYASAERLFACVRTRVGDADHASIWDPVAGRKLFDLPHLRVPVLDIAVSPDENVLALACVDHTVRLVDAHTGAAQRTLLGDREFWCVAFSPDGDLVAAGTGGEGEQNSGTVRIWEVATGHERPTLIGHGAQCLAFSPNGQRLGTGGADQAIKLWDIASAQEILTLRGHSDWIQGLAFTGDGYRLVSCGDRSVRIWDGSPWREGKKFGDDVVTLRGHADSVNTVAFRPRSAEIATASTDGTIKIWSTQTWRELRSLRTGFENNSALAFNPTGELLAVSGAQITQRTPVVILDANTGAELKRLGDATGSQVISFAAQGLRLAIASEDGSVVVYDVATGAIEKSLRTPGKFPYDMTFSPDGQLLAAGQDNKVTIWDYATGREVDGSPLRHSGLVYCVAFSPDGRFLASAGWDRAVRIWDTTSWKQVQMVIEAASGINCIAFNPDGSCLAWGATDSTIKLWNRNTDELRTLRGHLANVRGVAFSPDGEWLASGSEDGTAKIWKVTRDEMD
jgi:WD40 repeat protein/serine/threonine protein kinase